MPMHLMKWKLKECRPPRNPCSGTLRPLFVDKGKLIWMRVQRLHATTIPCKSIGPPTFWELTTQLFIIISEIDSTFGGNLVILKHTRFMSRHQNWTRKCSHFTFKFNADRLRANYTQKDRFDFI